MNGPAQTLNYMIAGYTVIFGIMTAYIVSLLLRWRRARRELADLQDLLDED
jgi:hypothetical protein